MSEPGFSINEVMVAAIARHLRDGELGFVGVGTAGRAYTVAVGIPIAAARLAQLSHAPDFTIYWGNLLSPDLGRVPSSWLQDTYTRWPSAAMLADCGQKLDMLTKGMFDVSFVSAAQVDRFGNLNITVIGEHDQPKVRLVGCLAQPELYAFVRRPIIVVDLDRRTFVEHVDFVTSFGHRRGGVVRAELDLPGPGPSAVFTDKAVFDFCEGQGEMRLVSLHPGVTIEEVLDNMAFVPVIPETTPETATPTPDQVRLIHEVIDPDRILLRV